MLTDNPAVPMILVVEAEHDHSRLIQRAFEDAAEEYRLEIVDTICAAKMVTEQNPPSLVVTDYHLPDGNGSELVVMAAGSWPVIMMTSRGNERIAVEAMKIGALDYIAKSPEAFEALPHTVTFALKTWSLILARRQADDAAFRAKIAWERTFDALPELISIIDTDHTVTHANKAMADRCGLPLEELVGRKCCEVVHGLKDPAACCPVAAMIQDSQIHTVEVKETRLNGIFDITVSPLIDNDGRISSYVHVMRDITDRKKTEELVHQRLKLRDMAPTSSVDELVRATLDACELLTDSSAGFFHLFDQGPLSFPSQIWSSSLCAAICTAEGLDTRYPIHQNGAWVECFQSREPVIHNDPADLKSQAQVLSGHAQAVRELAVPVVMDDTVVSIIGVGNKASPYTQHDVYVVRQYVTFATEVIGRKKSTVALEESEERHRKLANEQRIILNTTSVGIIFLKKRKVCWANPAFNKIFGYEPETTLTMDTAAFYPDKKSYESIGNNAYATITSGGIYSQDVLMKKKDGSPIWCNLVGQAISPGNPEEGSIWIWQDITERKRAEEDRQNMERQLQQTQKLESLGVLSGGIAHDFNNILTIILGHCYIVNDELESGNAHKAHIEQIQNAANRAADLCRQMLAYAGSSPLQKTQINMWLLVDEIVRMLKSAIKKNVEIQLDLNRDVPSLSGDNAQIQQVVMNLVINAAEAIGDQNGTIKIALNKIMIQTDKPEYDFTGKGIPAGRYACLGVSDTGCGIDEETKKRIFEPFFTTKFTGRGLGMSAVLGIIKSHGGSLQLISSPDVGTTFKVYIPLPVVQEQCALQTSSDTIEAAQSNATILLVDDEVTIRDMGTTLLETLGFSVITAANGREALALYKAHSGEIDLIMLDLIMPEMGGIEAYHELRRINQTVPIMICSGYSAESAAAVTKADDNAFFLNKPFNPVELVKALNENLIDRL